MDDINLVLASLGGLLSLFTFWHFVADWTFQSQKEALAKAKDRRVRAWHCCKYALAFVPLLLAMRMRTARGMFSSPSVELAMGWQLWTALAILFVSHYIIDSYVPVVLWCKHFRRPPQFGLIDRSKVPQNSDGSYTLTKKQAGQLLTSPAVAATSGWADKVIDRPVAYADDEEAFKAFVTTPLGLVLAITMDQLFHIAFLLPTIVVLLWP